MANRPQTIDTSRQAATQRWLNRNVVSMAVTSFLSDAGRHAVIQRLFHQFRLEFPKRCRRSLSPWDSDFEAFLAAESHQWLSRDEIFADASQDFPRDVSPAAGLSRPAGSRRITSPWRID
jgi:hypothetical protein